MTVISLREVSKTFRHTPLFKDVSVDFRRGASYALVGPNGSGKSVLLKIICGFVRPDSGDVRIDPSLLPRGRTFPDRFGIAINGPAYLAGQTGIENLMELARIQNRIDRREVRSIMQRLDLDPDLKQKMRHYSQGMKQKISLAQAFMEHPEVLLLDEPFNALDQRSVGIVNEMLEEERSKGTTVIFTSHESRDVEANSDVVFEIRNRQLQPL